MEQSWWEWNGFRGKKGGKRQKDNDERNVASLFCILLRCWNFMTLQKRKALQDLVIYSMVTIAFNSVVLGGKFGNEGGKPNMVFALNSLLWYPVPSRSPIRTGARLISLFLLHFLPSTYLLLPPSILPNSVPLPPPSPLIFWPLGIFHSIFCFGPSVPPPPSTAKAAQSPTAAAFSSQPFPGRASKDRKHYNILTYH